MKELSPEAAKGGELAYQLFLFELEEHMGCDFIADYIFSVKQVDWLKELTRTHGCKTVNVHFDCEPRTAYERYTRRNSEDQNREFLFGDALISVDSEDFERVSYGEIFEKVRAALYP